MKMSKPYLALAIVLLILLLIISPLYPHIPTPLITVFLAALLIWLFLRASIVTRISLITVCIIGMILLVGTVPLATGFFLGGFCSWNDDAIFTYTCDVAIVESIIQPGVAQYSWLYIPTFVAGVLLVLLAKYNLRLLRNLPSLKKSQLTQLLQSINTRALFVGLLAVAGPIAVILFHL
jgi:hypothetical protein